MFYKKASLSNLFGLIILITLMNSCLSCPPGTWGIYPCLNCMSECATCNISTQCNTCKPGYYHVSSNLGQCPQCSSNCTFCTSYTNCTACSPGYYVTGGACQPCQSPCVYCTGLTVCTSCVDGYYLSSSSCNICTSPCSKCITLDTTCTDCISGYYQSGSTCVGCTPPCANCFGSPTSCTSCMDLGNQSIPTCDCTSPAKYMDTSNTCQNCVSPCLNCSTSTSCDSCVSGYLFQPNSCIACTKPCSDCSGTITNCSTCIDLANQSPPLCQCPSGYILNSITYYCDQCTFPCVTCQNSTTECLTCASTYTYDSSVHTCTCLSGQYELLGTPNTCRSCTSPCQTCSSTSSHCDSCILGLDRHLLNNACICDDGYFENSGVCQQCTLPCATCTSATVCTSCNDSVNQQLTNCACNATFYMDTSYVCQSCNSPCLNCTDSTQCTSCVDTFYLSGSSCPSCTLPCKNCDVNGCLTCIDINQYINTSLQCVCQNGYFMDNNNCSLCQLPCVHCSTLLDCQTCIDSNQILNANRCVCKDGYYSVGNYCSQCQLPCTKCQSAADFCTECYDQNHELINNKCICKSGYGQSGVGGYNCSVCLLPCLECSFSVTTCTFCLDNSIYYKKDNECFCQNGYFMDNYTKQCHKCQPQCQTCLNDSDFCLSCADINHTFLGNQCFCGLGYYEDLSMRCSQCQKPCATCIRNKNECTSCVSEKQNLINNRCLCNDGYYMFDYDCQKCQSICTKCSTFNICTECVDGYYLDAYNVCAKCNMRCETCTDYDICTTCSQGYYMDLVDNCTSCISNCMECNDTTSCIICYDGYYYQENQCLQCSLQCKNCSSYEICTSCNNNFQLFTDTCICQEGYYQKNYECLKCDYPCLNCSDSLNCTKCAVIDNLNLLDQKCQCNDGYYWKEGFCLYCDETCKTCVETSTKCLSCDQEQNRKLTNYQCLCLASYFENQDQICIPCNSQEGKVQEICQYKDCSDQIWTYGEQCDDGNDIARDGCTNCKVDSNYSCTNIILQQSICFQCSSNCKKCTFNESIQQCLTCNEGYFVNQYSCEQCSDLCIECVGDKYNCKTCRFHKNISGKCELCEARQGYYSNYSTNQCYSICGDTFLAQGEQCDDGNLFNGDGCSKKCYLETAYICKDGICITPDYPIPLILKQGDSSLYNNQRQFIMKYETQLNVSSSFDLKSILNISFISSLEQFINYEHIMVSDLKKENQFYNLSAIIIVTLNKSSENEKLVLKFSEIDKIISFQGYPQQIYELSIQIDPFILIDEQTKGQVDTAVSGSLYILIILGAMALGALLFGGIDIFYNLLDTLQMLSYLKYVNTQFPFNLQSFFDFFGFAQLNFIANYFNFQSLLDSYIEYDDLKAPPTKISDDGYISLLLINGTSVITVWLTLLIVFVIALLVPHFFRQFKFKYYSDIPEKEKWTLRFKLLFLSFKIFIGEICYKVISEFMFSGMIRVHMSTAYDYSFTLCLQLYSFDTSSSDFLVRASSYYSLIALGMYIFVIYFILQILSLKQYYLRTKRGKQQYGAVLEGVNYGFFRKYINVISLSKKFLFMVILIFTYKNPLLQVFNLSLLMISQSMFILYFKPFYDRNEYKKQMSCEVMSSLTLILMSVLVVDDLFNYFEYQIRQNIGWCCIACISSILVTQFLIDIYQQWMEVIRRYKKLRMLIGKISRLFKSEPLVKASPFLFQAN